MKINLRSGSVMHSSAGCATVFVGFLESGDFGSVGPGVEPPARTQLADHAGGTLLFAKVAPDHSAALFKCVDKISYFDPNLSVYNF